MTSPAPSSAAAVCYPLAFGREEVQQAVAGGLALDAAAGIGRDLVCAGTARAAARSSRSGVTPAAGRKQTTRSSKQGLAIRQPTGLGQADGTVDRNPSARWSLNVTLRTLARTRRVGQSGPFFTRLAAQRRRPAVELESPIPQRRPTGVRHPTTQGRIEMTTSAAFRRSGRKRSQCDDAAA